MSKKQDIEIMAKLLLDRFGKVALTAEETASILAECSDRTLEKDRGEAIGIPFTRRNNKERGMVMYSIVAIAKTLIENEIKTI